MASQAATAEHPGGGVYAPARQDVPGQYGTSVATGSPQTLRLPLHEDDGTETAHSARAFTKQCLREWQFTDAAYICDVALVVSELVSNAVRHARGAEELRLVHRSAGITIEVDDTGPGRPVQLPHSQVRAHGRGLAIVAALACRWSVQMRGSGRKTVRAVLGYPPLTAAA